MFGNGLLQGLALLVMCFAPALFAGPVNTPQSVPYALANARGDLLSFGNLKGILSHRWGGQELREAVIRWQRPVYTQELWTGGLAEAERWEPSRPAAIACSGREIQIFTAQRSPAHPGGFWQSRPATSEGVQCAMQDQGHFVVVDRKAARLLLDDQLSFDLPAVRGELRILSSGSAFLLLSSRGDAWQLQQQGSAWRWFEMSVHPFGEFGPLTSLRAQKSLVLRADGEEVRLARFVGERWTSSERLPVQPCEESVGCGASLAQDESWLVSGYWGHYLGVGPSFLRLNIPLSAQRESSVAIAHQGLGGAFIYLGSDDGDKGTLPASLAKATGAKESERWFVWETASSNRSSLAESSVMDLGAITLDRSGFRGAVAEESLQLRIWEGPLPLVIPQTWKAWEPSHTLLWSEDDARIQADTTGFRAAWWRESLGIRKAQQLLQSSGLQPQVIRVAMVDSGTDLQHPWLKDQLWTHPDEVPGNGLDDDGNGYVDDVHGYDFVDEDPWPQDSFGHGTHVAGLLAGASSSEQGVAPNLRLIVARALDGSGKSNSIDLARSLAYAVRQGAEIINCSWGGGSDTQALRDVFALIQQRGVLVISSAGNDGFSNDKGKPQVPKRYPGVLSVGAIEKSGKLARFSNYGQNTVEFLTPGDAIISTLPGGIWGEKSGTSMSAPLGTAAIAWIWGVLRSQTPESSPQQSLQTALALLCKSADQERVESRSRCGRLRLDRAVEVLLREQGLDF